MPPWPTTSSHPEKTFSALYAPGFRPQRSSSSCSLRQGQRSDWVQHEIGVAVGLGKPIIAVTQREGLLGMLPDHVVDEVVPLDDDAEEHLVQAIEHLRPGGTEEEASAM
jgi:hypothetical protein